MKRGRLILCVTAIFAALYWAFLIPYTVAELRAAKPVYDREPSHKANLSFLFLKDHVIQSPEQGFSNRTDAFRNEMLKDLNESGHLYVTGFECVQPHAAAFLDAAGNVVAKTDTLLWVTDMRRLSRKEITDSLPNNDRTVYSGYLGELLTEAQKKELCAYFGYTSRRYNRYCCVVPMPVVSASFCLKNGALEPVALTFQNWTSDEPLTLTFSDLAEDVVYTDAADGEQGYQISFIYWAPEGSFIFQPNRFGRLAARVERQAQQIREGNIPPDFDEIHDGLLRFREDAVKTLESDEGKTYYFP